MTTFAEAGPAEWAKNADVGGGDGEWAYVQGYREAGDTLVAEALISGRQDVLFYPAAFTYRHAIELSLKIAVDYALRLVAVSCDTGFLPESERLAAEATRTRTTGTHNLQVLTNELRRVLGLFTSERWPASVLKPIRELERLDPKGESFRYHVARDGKSSLPPKTVNIENLRQIGNAVDFILGGTVSWLDYQLQNALDYRHMLREQVPSEY